MCAIWAGGILKLSQQQHTSTHMVSRYVYSMLVAIQENLQGALVINMYWQHTCVPAVHQAKRVCLSGGPNVTGIARFQTSMSQTKLQLKFGLQIWSVALKFCQGRRSESNQIPYGRRFQGSISTEMADSSDISMQKYLAMPLQPMLAIIAGTEGV